MNRRKFFGAMAGTAIIPSLALAKQQPTFDPIVSVNRLPVDADLSLYSVMDAAGVINGLAKSTPKTYRLTTGPWLYIEARSTVIRDAMRDEYQTDIVVVMDRSFTDTDKWSLDACGVKVWSPGA